MSHISDCFGQCLMKCGSNWLLDILPHLSLLPPAWQKSHRGLAVLSLEQLVGRSSSTQQVFTALRCLVRLKLTFLGSEQAEKM